MDIFSGTSMCKHWFISKVNCLNMPEVCYTSGIFDMLIRNVTITTTGCIFKLVNYIININFIDLDKIKVHIWLITL